MKTQAKKLIYILLLFVSQYIYASNTINNNEIKLQLQWKHQFQFAGYYIAKEKGFYKDYGLKVHIEEKIKGIDVVKEVLNGKATFATGRSSLVVNKANNDDIVILAAIYQSSPHILLALKDSNIKSVKEFKNKRVMMTGQAKKDLTFLGMMYSEKLTTDDLIIKKHSYNLEDLVNKKTDLMASYISNEPFRLKEKYNLESVVFDPKDYGFDFYNDILFTKGSTARQQSMMVQKFKKASLKGWKYAFDNIEETVDIILKHYNTQNKTRKELIYEAKELKRLAYYKTNQIGKIEKMKIEKIYDAYKLIGLVKNQFKIDDFIFNFNTIDQITQKEYNYLKSKQAIKVCVDPNWMPYERINKKGELEGLSKDFFVKTILKCSFLASKMF